MKKIALLLVVTCIISSAYQCRSSTPNDIEKTSPCGTPDWLTKIITNTEQSGNKGKVVQYQYNGENVFLLDTCIGCADDLVVVYNCAGATRCEFGGIAGFNTCPDFTEKAIDGKTIWSN